MPLESLGKKVRCPGCGNVFKTSQSVRQTEQPELHSGSSAPAIQAKDQLSAPVQKKPKVVDPMEESRLAGIERKLPQRAGQKPAPVSEVAGPGWCIAAGALCLIAAALQFYGLNRAKNPLFVKVFALVLGSFWLVVAFGSFLRKDAIILWGKRGALVLAVIFFGIIGFSSGASPFAPSGSFTDAVLIAAAGLILFGAIWFVLTKSWFHLHPELAPKRPEGMEDGKERVGNKDILQDEAVVRFYKNTMSAWAAGEMAEFGEVFKKQARLPYDKFVKIYSPIEGSALYVFLTQFRPREKEIMVGLSIGADKSFVLTNYRLIQKNGTDGNWLEFELAKVKSYSFTKGFWGPKVVFDMKSGNKVNLEKFAFSPSEKLFRTMIGRVSR